MAESVHKKGGGGRRRRADMPERRDRRRRRALERLLKDPQDERTAAEAATLRSRLLQAEGGQ